ncbi:MAG: hypothetical protein IT168_01510 [Bryobacterales bacterium]|nr:hypothetical protein [Bryobacterales bacterium]
MAERLRQDNDFFKPKSNNGKLLKLYADKFPDGATDREASSVLGHVGASTPVSRLRADLVKCFRTDRTLWEQQQMLILSDKGAKRILELRPLWETLPPSMIVWFHQCARVPMPQRRDEPAHNGELQPFIVLSEPLFFYVRKLGAYFRFLDINHDAMFRSKEKELVAAAKKQLHQIFPEMAAQTGEFVADMDMVPVRLYLPAGDSYAKTAIRRWFRDNLQHRVGYKEASAVAVTDSVNSNIIVLASRSSLPLLAQFQEQHELRLRLTGDGISCGDLSIADEARDGEGATLSRVIVTNWTFETGRVHTYVASNHTRAIRAVAELLVSDAPMLKDIAGSLLINGTIASRFQLAFDVELHFHETTATVKGLLPQLEGKPLLYR